MRKTSTKLWINGFDGRMGQSIRKLLLDDPHFELLGGSSHERIFFSEAGSKQDQFLIEPYSDDQLIQGLKKAELLIDFSSVEGNEKLCKVLTKHKLTGLAVLVGSTGLKEKSLHAWQHYCAELNGKVLIAPNTSLGVYLSVKLAQQAASLLRPMDFDIEILEAHHRHKKDAPSGTALFIAEMLAEQENLQPIWKRDGLREEDEIGIAVLRGGSVFGEHEIRFMGELEELSIAHRALSRQLFAEGALKLGRWIDQAAVGRLYRLVDIPIEEMAGLGKR
ncbi:MAG: 4-hydroxy-tetrahydrodipicolinate reductase [Oligoflexus sp.]